MSPKVALRMTVFAALLLGLLITLLGRTAFLQASSTQYRAEAAANRVRTEVLPAPRGAIVDDRGRALVTNRAPMVVLIDRNELYRLPGDGAEVVTRLAGLLGTSFEDLDARLTPCSSESAVPGVCFDGGSAAAIQVAVDVEPDAVLAIRENPALFPAVQTRASTVRSYPAVAGVRAAHVLGTTGPVTAEDLQAADDPGALADAGLVGRSGLERQYDEELRGRPGKRTVEVDSTGAVTGQIAVDPAVPGATLQTSISAPLQAVVEKQLRAAVDRARANTSRELAADSAAAVVVDVRTGRIKAMASYPDYKPDIWVGGISRTDYARLVDRDALFFRPMQGGYAPGSTFKPFTVAAMAAAGLPLNATYDCPSTYTAGGRSFANFDSEGYGPISLQRAIEVSCNTVFYQAADRIWRRTGGADAPATAPDPIWRIPSGFGLGRATGVDLPGESGGQVSGRRTKAALWQERKDAWCAAADEGYPQLRRTDPALADEYTALDRENCLTGYKWQQGDALNAAIGQGLTTVTPLQLAMSYAALANGGTVYRPTVARRILDADGDVVRSIAPEAVGRAPVDSRVLAFLREAMVGVTTRGSAAGAFAGYPSSRLPVAGKTGSAQVSGGKPSTSWFASYAPADDPKYAVVMMVTQGGTGAGTSAPSVRAIYEAIFGIRGSSIDPARSVLAPPGRPAGQGAAP